MNVEDIASQKQCHFRYTA